MSTINHAMTSTIDSIGGVSGAQTRYVTSGATATSYNTTGRSPHRYTSTYLPDASTSQAVYRSPNRYTMATVPSESTTVYRSPHRYTTTAGTRVLSNYLPDASTSTGHVTTQYVPDASASHTVYRSPTRYTQTTGTRTYTNMPTTTTRHYETSTHVPTAYIPTDARTTTTVYRSPSRYTTQTVDTRGVTHDHETVQSGHRMTVGELATRLGFPVEHLVNNREYPQMMGLTADSPAPHAQGEYTRSYLNRDYVTPKVVEKVVAPPPDRRPVLEAEEQKDRTRIMGEYIAAHQREGTEELKERINLVKPAPKRRDYTGMGPFVGFGLTETTGTQNTGSLPVETIWENGPAWDAGLRLGDEVVQVGNNSRPVNSLRDVQETLRSEAKIGQSLPVVAVQNGQRKNLTIVPKTTHAKAGQEGWNDVYFNTKSHQKLGETTGNIQPGGVKI